MEHKRKRKKIKTVQPAASAKPNGIVEMSEHTRPPQSTNKEYHEMKMAIWKTN